MDSPGSDSKYASDNNNSDKNQSIVDNSGGDLDSAIHDGDNSQEKSRLAESEKVGLVSNGVDKEASAQECTFLTNGHASPGSDKDANAQAEGLTYDGVLTSLGEFGRYQKWMCFLLCLPSVSSAMQILITVFTLAMPDHRCALPGVANDTWEVQSEHHESIINGSIPPGPSSLYAKCHTYLPANGASIKDNGNFTGTGAWSNESSSTEAEYLAKTQSCSRYVYDQSLYISTMATELDLVCDRSLYRSHAQMMVMVGSLLGSQIIGLIADMWGRKIAIMLSILLHVTSAFVLTWARSYVMLLVFNVPLGMSVSGMICSTFVLSMELVGPRKRIWPGYGIMAAWSTGMILLAPLAFWLRDWSHLQLATSIFTLPLLAFWWLIPESPRWLLSKGRLTEAETIITRAARINRVTLPAGVLDKAHTDAKTAGLPLWKACFSVRLFFRHLIIFFAWFVLSLTYYGLSWNVGTLGGSVYVNLALSGAVELVSFVVCILLLDRIGRRALCCALLTLAGVTCTATILPVLFAPPSLQWVTVVLAMTGKLGTAGAFGTIYIFSSELFPTVLRNSGMGTSSVCARVGGIIAPYIANMAQSIEGDAATAVPLVIFGVSSMIAGFLLFFLPETLRRRLPETIQDAINMRRKVDKSNTTETEYEVSIQS